MKRKEKRRRERKNRKETGRGVKAIFVACASLTSTYDTRTNAALYCSAGTSRIKCGHKPTISNKTCVPLPE